ncbi:hypothetical protein D3C87_1323430 [compost metagenome]
MDLARGDVELPAADVSEALGLGEEGLARQQRLGAVDDLGLGPRLLVAELLLAALAFGDVLAGADPLDDPGMVVEDRKAAGHEPTIGAVVPPQAVLGLVALHGLDRMPPGLGGALPVEGVDGVKPARTPRLLPALAGEAAPLGSLDQASLRVGEPHDLRGGAHQRPVAGLQPLGLPLQDGDLVLEALVLLGQVAG